MKKNIFLALVLFLSASLTLSAQSAGQDAAGRFALVVGNGDYAGLGKLKNPEADARDIAAALEKLAFSVEMLVDADLPSMEDAVVRFGGRLSTSKNAVGFFFYAGHGIQSGGANYLIPADARIPSEAYLRTKSLSAQSVLETMQAAGNGLNIVVLDACRDNPFSWARSGARGLSVVGAQPPGSIIVYATSAGSVALDGTGRNGVFTAELLKQLSVPGSEVKEIFTRTGAAVQTASGWRQVPAIYSQFFGTAYLSGVPGGRAAGRTGEAGSSAAAPLLSPKALADYRRGMENVRAMDLGGLNRGKVDSSLLKLLLPAADEGHALARLWIGILNYFHEYGTEDQTESLRWLRLAAEQLPDLRRTAESGDLDARMGLALFYLMEELADKGIPASREEALSWCRLAAEQGHPLAQIILGSTYEAGRGVERSAAEAAKWYRRAAEKGEAEAMGLLGSLYRSGGPGLDPDAAEAVKWLRRAADKGDASAMASLGALYAEGGPGLAKNGREAEKWLRKALDAGYIYAAYNLARLYREGGPGLSADAKKAAELYRTAADKGEGYALVSLAELYLSGGPGLKADAKKAAAVYREAADKGDEEAASALARLYLEGGPGLPADAKKAAELFQAALEEGDEDAFYSLVQLYIDGGPGLPADARKAAELYRRKADVGDVNAMLELGRLYLYGGPALPKNAAEAENWYTKAAGLGSAHAKWAVGMMYIEGNGVAKDSAKGISWCVKAAESGGRDGTHYAYSLALDYYHGDGIPQNHEEALRWYREAAHEGASDAQSQLGWMYYAGEGTRPNHAEAARWWRMAADQGHPWAQYNLGLLYLNGEGVGQDFVFAHLWLNLAASRYDPGENRDEAARDRDDVALKMTPGQLAEAQKLAREWQEKQR